jgi:tetratricopeptide (TPR) repeat protein
VANQPHLDPPHFIPPPRTFIGRGDDQQQILQRLAGQRGLLIQGVSGVGKSALAWETARWLVTRGRVAPERVYFVSLNNLHTADDARAALATALGVQVGALASEAAERALLAALPEHALLVLDEAEGVVRAGGLALRRLLERLLQAEASPRVLVTSQSDVASAYLPVYTLQRLLPQAALELFATTANLTAQEWAALDHDDLAAVLGYVDRVPRAVDLVARAWRKARSLDLKPLLAELAARHDAVMVDPNYPDEVKSVTVGIALAYDRLRGRSVAASELFLRLGLFAGGLPEAGVAAIFGADAHKLVALIQDDSLLERPWPDLLYLPTPLRLFAIRTLGAAAEGERAQWGEAVLRFYHRLEDEAGDGHADQLDRHLQRAGDVMAAVIDRYSQELASIEAWLDWAYAAEPCRGERLRGPRLTALLENIYMVTDRLRASRARLAAALTAALRCRDRGGEANVQKALGDLALREDDLGEARRRYAAALAIYPDIGARLGEANVQQALGDLALREADLGEARVRYAAALAIYPQIGARLGEANVLQALGDLALREDDLGEARVRYAAALAIYPQIGARLGEANVLQALGDLALREDDLGEARRRYAAALAIYPDIGARLGEANVQAALARIEMLEGNDPRAMTLLGRAIDFYQSVNDRYSIAAALANFGLTLRGQGRQEEAAPLLRQAADLFEQIDLPQYAVQLRGAASPTLSLAEQVQRIEAAVTELRQRGESAQLREALAVLTSARFDAENWRGVIESAQELFELGAEDGRLWAMTADAQARLDNEEAAAAAYAKAVALDATNAMLRRNYANILIALNRLGAAAEELEAAARLDPDAPYLALRYAELAKAGENRGEAMRWAAEALRRQPGWDEAQTILTWASEAET